MGKVKNYEAQIKLTENRYIARKPYRCSFKDIQEIEKQITELLKRRLIDESTSPFAAPVTFAYKKENGEKNKNRSCVGFRELNKLLITEIQPFPLIDDIIIRTRNCNWYTVLDIS